MEATKSKALSFIDDLFKSYCIVCGEETKYYVCDKCRKAILWIRKIKEEQENETSD